MKIEERLAQKKEMLVKSWFEILAKTYPLDTSSFLLKRSDPFSNPVGATGWNGLTAVFEELIGGMDREAIKATLDPLIRIRAVQSFSPSKATAFIFSLKQVIRKQFAKELSDLETMKALWGVESRIDELALITFDIYMGCRERLNRIKATEERKRTFAAFERAGLVSELPDELDRVSP